MAHAQQGGEAPERSYVAAMFDDDSRYSGNLFVDATLVTPMKSLWPVPGTRLKQFDSVMRILPGKRDDGTWSAFRVSTGKGHFGRWLYSAWAARAIGDPAVTFFLCSDKDVQDNGYDPRQHPVYILYNSIYWAVDEGNAHVKAHWAPMVNSKQRKVIQKPKPMFLAQCLIYGRGEKVYDPPMGTEDGEKVVCFDLASDGGKSLRALLDQRRPDDDPAAGTGSFAEYYKYGDITAFDGGKFVQLYPAKHSPNRDAPAPAPQGPRRSLSRASVAEGRGRTQKARGDDDERERVGYEVEILDEYEGWDPVIEPDLAAALEEKIHPWPDIVKVPDHKTAASYLWSRMRFGGELKLDVLLYAWQDHPEWLPDKDSEVWAEWVNRKQVATGYDPDAGVEADESDRRPRQRFGDTAERADDQPRPNRRAGLAPAPAATSAAAPTAPPDDAEPPPQRGASRLVDRQEAVDAAAQAGVLKGRVARERKPPAAEPAVAGERAAPDVAAAATSFRPSATAAAAGFAEPPAASTQAAEPQANGPAPPAGKPNPKDVLAAARAKFTNGAK